MSALQNEGVRMREKCRLNLGSLLPTMVFTLREKSAQIYLGQTKFVIVLQPKRIFRCNKEKKLLVQMSISLL